jgi:potassium/chloride transporter 4/5/6
VLVLVKLDDDFKPCSNRLLSFSSQLKAGKGLTLVSSVLQAEFKNSFGEVSAAKQVCDVVYEMLVVCLFRPKFGGKIFKHLI